MLAVAAGFALTVLVFFPGYITIDARYVYADARAWRFGDWQSPAMAVLWRLIDPIAPGALSMFLLTAVLYWIGFGVLALIAARRAFWLGVVAVLLAFMPPAFFFVGMVWRDVLFGVVWLAAAVLTFAVVDCAARWRLPVQALSLLLIVFGVLLRPECHRRGSVSCRLCRLARTFRSQADGDRRSFRRSSCSTRLFRSSITACWARSGRTRCTRSWSSISAASPTSAVKTSSRWHGAPIRRRC